MVGEEPLATKAWLEGCAMELGEKPYDLDELVVLIAAAQTYVSPGALRERIIDKLYQKVELALAGAAEEQWAATLLTEKEAAALLLALEQWRKSQA
jgi:hypothetical protein